MLTVLFELGGEWGVVFWAITNMLGNGLGAAEICCASRSKFGGSQPIPKHSPNAQKRRPMPHHDRRNRKRENPPKNINSRPKTAPQPGKQKTPPSQEKKYFLTQQKTFLTRSLTKKCDGSL